MSERASGVNESRGCMKASWHARLKTRIVVTVGDHRSHSGASGVALALRPNFRRPLLAPVRLEQQLPKSPCSRNSEWTRLIHARSVTIASCGRAVKARLLL